MSASLLDPAVRRKVKPQPKECWWNAIRAGCLLAKQPHASVLYVEGFAVMRNFRIAFEHSWLLVGGEVVEATLDHLCESYHAAKTYAPEDARALSDAQKDLGMPLTGWPGFRDPRAYMEAQASALAASLGQPIEVVRKFLNPNATKENRDE